MAKENGDILTIFLVNFDANIVILACFRCPERIIADHYFWSTFALSFVELICD